MKKSILITLMLAFVATLSFAQPRMNPRPFIDFSKYEKVDSLPLERILLHFENGVDIEDAIYTGGGDYMVTMPHKDRIIIRTNADRTQAIVLYNSYCFGRHFEFNVQENERRIVLWYKGNRTYCGYIYDKVFKVCKYFESKKEYKRFIRNRE